MSYIYPTRSGELTKYRVYYLHLSKRIYIGLYDTLQAAEVAYATVQRLMQTTFTVSDFPRDLLSFSKFIELLNFKNNKVYFNTPLLIEAHQLKYFLDESTVLLFDLRELMFLSNYKIHKRGAYLYIYMGTRQESLLKRFGIPNHATYGIDYYCKNGNLHDLRRENIVLCTHYKGVKYIQKFNCPTYVARILVKNYIVIGHYDSELHAAIAYNKAIDLITSKDSTKEYVKNEFPFLTRSEYQSLYEQIPVSKRLTSPSVQNRKTSSKAYRGISKDKSGHRASIGFGGKQIYLGIYPTEKRAAQAYNYASLYLFGPHGYVNEVTPLTHGSDQEKIASKIEKAGFLKTKGTVVKP